MGRACRSCLNIRKDFSRSEPHCIHRRIRGRGCGLDVGASLAPALALVTGPAGAEFGESRAGTMRAIRSSSTSFESRQSTSNEANAEVAHEVPIPCLAAAAAADCRASQRARDARLLRADDYWQRGPPSVLRMRAIGWRSRRAGSSATMRGRRCTHSARHRCARTLPCSRVRLIGCQPRAARPSRPPSAARCWPRQPRDRVSRGSRLRGSLRACIGRVVSRGSW